MKIKTTQHCVHEWTAIDDDTYDGPESKMGIGNSEAEAIEDLKEKMGFYETDWSDHNDEVYK